MLQNQHHSWLFYLYFFVPLCEIRFSHSFICFWFLSSSYSFSVLLTAGFYFFVSCHECTQWSHGSKSLCKIKIVLYINKEFSFFVALYCSVFVRSRVLTISTAGWWKKRSKKQNKRNWIHFNKLHLSLWAFFFPIENRREEIIQRSCSAQSITCQSYTKHSDHVTEHQMLLLESQSIQWTMGTKLNFDLIASIK